MFGVLIFSALGGLIGGSASFQEGNYVGGGINVYGINVFNDINEPFNYTCFPRGTKITLSNGELKNIEEIKIGDQVLSFNQEKKILEGKLVQKTFIREAKKLLEIKLSNGVTIKPTPDHEFYVSTSIIWLEAGKLKVGDKLLAVRQDAELHLDSQLNEVSVESINELPGTTVYNLMVEDTHTYFAENILVHNENDYDKQLGREVLIKLDEWGNPIITGQVINDDNWRNNYNQTFNDLLQINAINNNFSQAQRDAFANEITNLQLTTVLYANQQLADPNSLINREIQRIRLQMKIEQGKTAILAEPEFAFGNVGNRTQNLSSAQKDINRIINNIKNDPSLSDDEKNNQTAKWKNLSHYLDQIILANGLYQAGLDTARIVGFIAGGEVAIGLGATSLKAMETASNLIKTPAGQKILLDIFLASTASSVSNAVQDPLMQSLYAEVLKEEHGIQKALGIGFVSTFIKGAGALASLGELAPLGNQTVTVFRVEGAANQRLVIGENGEVAILGDNTLFLNFGSRERAEEYLQQKIDKGLPGATIKKFEVPQTFLDDLRSIAVREKDATRNPTLPFTVDITKAADQYGLRKDQIEQLNRTIIQGTGALE